MSRETAAQKKRDAASRRAAARKLAAQIRKTAREEVHRGKQVFRGQITSTATLAVDLFDSELTLREDDIVFSQWMDYYRAEVGLEEGDILLLYMETDDWTAFDVMSDANLAGLTPALSFRTTHHFVVQGNIVTTAVLAIPPFFASIGNGSLSLRGVYYKLETGSASIEIRKNGTAVAMGDPVNATSISVDTTARSTGANIDLSDGDLIALAVTGIGGSPKNLSVTLAFEQSA